VFVLSVGGALRRAHVAADLFRVGIRF